MLIADDNADAVQTLAMLLEVFGTRSPSLMTGKGLRLMSRFVRVAVLDIGMPGLDGYEVRAHPLDG